MAKNSIGTNEKRLTEWIRKNAYEERSEGVFIRITVRHVVNKTKAGDEMHAVDVPPEGPNRTENWERELATDILSALTMEASQFGGMQHYACYSHFSESEKTVNRCVVSIQGTMEDNNDDGILSEGPNAAGLVGMTMRHQEANARIFTGSLVQILDSYRRQNDRLMTMNEKLLESRFELLETMAEVVDDKHKRILESKKEEAKIRGVEEGISMLKSMVPVIVNQATGRKILPESMSGVAPLAKSFFGSLTEEQHAALAQIFRKDQLIQFFSMAETLVDADEKEQKPNNQQGNQS